MQLHRWGLLDDVLGTARRRSARSSFHAGGTCVERGRSRIAPASTTRRAAAPRPRRDARRRRGARRRHADARGPSVDGATPGRRRSGDRHLRTRRGRPVRSPARAGRRRRRAAVADRPGGRRAHAAVRRPAAAPPTTRTSPADWDGIEYYLGDRVFAGVFPTHNGEACVWVCLPGRRRHAVRRVAPRESSATFDAMLRHASPRARRAARTGARRSSPMRGAIGLPNHVRRPSARGGRWSATPATTATRSPGTASATPSATPSSSPSALDAALRGDVDEVDALAGYQRRATAAAARSSTSRATLATFPPPDRSSSCRRDSAGRSTPRPSAPRGPPCRPPLAAPRWPLTPPTTAPIPAPPKEHHHDHHRHHQPTATASTPPRCSPPSTR